MADNKIVHRISLEGAEDVVNRLKKVGDAGEESSAKIQKSIDASQGSIAKFGDGHADAFKSVKRYTDDLASSLAKAGEAFAAIEGKTEGGRVAVERFREIIHTLHPVLDEAGIGISNLGSFARLAGGGFGALAAAVVGSVLVGLAKLRDEADKTKRSLDIIAGGTGSGAGGGPGAKGSGLFESYKKDAENAGTSLAKVLPLAQQLTELKAKQEAAQRSGGQIFSSAFKNSDLPPGAIRLPEGGVVTDEQNRAAVRATIAAGRLDRTPPEAAAKQIAALIGSANSGKGVLTEDALSTDKLAPSLGQALTTALRDAGAIGGNIRTTAQLQESIRSGQTEVRGDQIVPALARDELKFREQASQLPLTFTEALEKTEVQVQKFGETLGDAGVKILGVLGDIEHSTVDNAAKGFNALGKGEHAVVDSDIVQNANKLVHGDLSNAYRTEPLPPSATNGARSEAEPVSEPAVQPQQIASLSSALVDFISSVSAALTRNKDTTVTNPVTIGVRGATGGHVRGPGTSTSDSIPAMLSDKEYVLNAKAVERVGVENLDAINSGRAHFADGGSVTDQAQAAAKQKEQEQIDKELDALEQERSNAEAKYQKDINGLNAPEKVDVRPGTERPKPSLKSQFTTTGTGFDGAIDVRRAADLKADAAYDEQNTSVVDSDADRLSRDRTTT